MPKMPAILRDYLRTLIRLNPDKTPQQIAEEAKQLGFKVTVTAVRETMRTLGKWTQKPIVGKKSLQVENVLKKEIIPAWEIKERTKAAYSTIAGTAKRLGVTLPRHWEYARIDDNGHAIKPADRARQLAIKEGLDATQIAQRLRVYKRRVYSALHRGRKKGLNISKRTKRK